MGRAFFFTSVETQWADFDSPIPRRSVKHPFPFLCTYFFVPNEFDRDRGKVDERLDELVWLYVGGGGHGPKRAVKRGFKKG